MTPQVFVSGRALTLGRLIGKGGEGEVYSVASDPDHAVKIYTTDDRLSRHDKVAAMVRCDLAKRSPLAAFPVAVVKARDGSFAGFVMKLLNGYRPLHELYAPGSRKQHFPQADYRFLSRAASNIAKAFAAIHATNCVVGDINHSGILVSTKATAALIDADSFQFSDGGNRYLCRVGVPEYTPPELQGKPLHGVVRTTDHDAFGLAVVIFQLLLMGRHPFVGTVRKGDIPPLHENVQNFRYVYTDSRDVGMDQPPGTPALLDFAPELAQLFDRAFSQKSLGSRPSAGDWVQALERFESTLGQCADNPLHYGPKDASECAWCEMERLLGTFLFLPYLPTSQAAPQVDPGKASFDLELIWARIERVRVAPVEQLQPYLPTLTPPTPSEPARQAKTAKGTSSHGTGLLLLAAAVVVMFVAPKAWILALLLAGFALANFGSSPSVPVIDGTRFRNEFVDAQTQWYREVDGWRRRVGHSDLASFKETLQTARQRFLEIKAEERRLADDYKARRRERQLSTYLEGFDIARADLKGIGPAKIAVLSSFGIDTAADIMVSRLQTVPGFGDALIGRLVEWRRRHEGRFVYNASPNDADRQEAARLSSLIEAKLSPLRAALSSGAPDLEQRARRVHDFAQKEDPVLVKVHYRVAQAKVDLEYLGLSLPHVPLPNAPRAPAPARPVVAPSPTHSTQAQRGTARGRPPAAAPPCPRCSGAMRQRLARRGRNAGNYFWGCSRYPSCKGTRPI